MKGLLLPLAAALAISCESVDFFDKEMGMVEDRMAGSDGENGDGNGNSKAGTLTAGQWRDLDNWGMWSGLMLEGDYTDKSEYWGFYTNNRVAVKVTDAKGNPLAGIKVALQKNGTAIWETVTDNHGSAECWVGLFQPEKNLEPEDLRISLNGAIQEKVPSLTTWVKNQDAVINNYTLNSTVKPSDDADIAFIVDATGSMGDEIAFLKNDLEDIIQKVSALKTTTRIRTSALFYRDEGDEYVTRVSDFSSQLANTSEFVAKQDANGGGDYPEAVHTALEQSLQKLSWDESARSRVAFIFLDAPAHHESKVIGSLQKSIALYAEKGIKLVPIAASGVDKNTEFMLRFFSSVTNATYVFLTDDSGVGGSHIEPTVGEFEVEPLNSLIVKLINYYLE